MSVFTSKEVLAVGAENLETVSKGLKPVTGRMGL